MAGDLIQVNNKVIVLDEVSSKTASIYDVVLPMLGYDSILPDNEVGRYCETLLRNENVSFDKDSPAEATAKGSYRQILAKADHVSYEMIPDQDRDKDEDNDLVNVKFSFDLPTGTYATMFFRELMLTTVARTR